ncbi:MAG: c-type cytochrome [Sphingobacteriales bacterium]|nr:MAG: c-type cytochrome [Sphingobacteriales bacterium]
MKKFLKWTGIVVLVFVFAATGGFFYMKKAYPLNIPKQEITIAKDDSALIKRGEYLANNVTGCIDCHSTRQLDKFAIPRLEGTEGMGGMKFPKEFGLPGTLYSKNITPAALHDWTDADIYHTITTGIRKNGEPLFPLMPYKGFGQGDPEDMRAIVAYLRTLKPIENKEPIPESELDFPLNLIVRTIPSAAAPTKRPPMSDTVNYGKYMVTIAGCTDCHTPMKEGAPLPGMEFAGGNEYFLPMGTVRSANITPDPVTGIGAWNKEMFVNTFKFHAKPENKNIPWQKRGYQTIMGWYEYSGMTNEDLGAIYTYLHTLKPVEHKVVKFTAAGEKAPQSAMK